MVYIPFSPLIWLISPNFHQKDSVLRCFRYHQNNPYIPTKLTSNSKILNTYFDSIWNQPRPNQFKKGNRHNNINETSADDQENLKKSNFTQQ